LPVIFIFDVYIGKKSEGSEGDIETIETLPLLQRGDIVAKTP
jgi:hypothetical protein